MLLVRKNALQVNEPRVASFLEPSRNVGLGLKKKKKMRIWTPETSNSSYLSTIRRTLFSITASWSGVTISPRAELKKRRRRQEKPVGQKSESERECALWLSPFSTPPPPPPICFVFVDLADHISATHMCARLSSLKDLRTALLCTG